METVKPPEEKRCAVCQGRLVLVCEDVYLRFDTPFQFFQDGLSMNVYECEDCHRLDFYNASPDAPIDAEKEDLVVCPTCGQEHSKHINCPNCLMGNGFPSSLRKRTQKAEKKTSRKKNDVPWEL